MENDELHEALKAQWVLLLRETLLRNSCFSLSMFSSINYSYYCYINTRLPGDTMGLIYQDPIYPVVDFVCAQFAGSLLQKTTANKTCKTFLRRVSVIYTGGRNRGTLGGRIAVVVSTSALSYGHLHHAMPLSSSKYFLLHHVSRCWVSV